MALLNLSLPVIGQSSATEDQKVRDALVAIQAGVNGNLDQTNLAATTTLAAVGGFYAYRTTAAGTIASNQAVGFDAELFDVSGWHDTTTNVGRYTPQIAGYYRFSWGVQAGVAQATDVFWLAMLYKNGAEVAAGQVGWQRPVAFVNSTGSAIAQANGSTDYFTVVVAHNAAAAQSLNATSGRTFFCGELIGR